MYKYFRQQTRHRCSAGFPQHQRTEPLPEPPEPPAQQKAPFTVIASVDTVTVQHCNNCNFMFQTDTVTEENMVSRQGCLKKKCPTCGKEGN